MDASPDLRPAADAAKIEGASPTLSDLASEIGGSVQVVNGQPRVYFRDPSLSAHENDQRSKRALGAMEKRRAVQREVSQDRETRHRATIRVLGPAGDERILPESREDSAAAKPGVQAVKYWGRRRKRALTTIGGKLYRVGPNGQLEER